MPVRSPSTYARPNPLSELLSEVAVSGPVTTVKAAVDLPARLYGGNAQKVEVSALDYTLHLDLSKLPESPIPTLNDGKWTVVWDEVENTYKRVEFSHLPGGEGIQGEVGPQGPPGPQGIPGAPGVSGDYNTLANKPATFPPSAHTHAEYVVKTGDTMSGALTINNELIVKGGVSGGYGRIRLDDAGGDFNSGLTFRHGGVDGWEITHISGDLGLVPTAPSTSKVYINATTASTSTTTGALTVAGGAGIGGIVHIADALFVNGANAAWVTGSKLTVKHAQFEYGIAVRAAAAADTPGAMGFFNVAGGVVGGINASAAATAFVTSSDGRLKEDLKSFDAGNIVDQIEVYDFLWKNIGERAYGIVAQQAVEVYPQAITYDERRDWWGVDYSKYVPVLLQELKALRARVAALEGPK